MTDMPEFAGACPIPIADYPHVLMAHGGGGRLMHQLIERIFATAFGLPDARERHDSAVLTVNAGVQSRIAFTTDSFVVRPLFFPGGDIGTLAVNGTVNDLAMSGATPQSLSAGFILEEGLPIADLWRIACSMRSAADKAGVRIVTGDTKVVDRGKGDGVYINTAGIGPIESDCVIAAGQVRPGDAVILSGDIGRHGMAIMAQREGLEFETTIVSDCAPLNHAVARLMATGIEIHCMRDLTRGGLAAGLVEISDGAGATIRIDETAIPVDDEVAGACEILGFDPIYVANEGCFVAFVPKADASAAVDALRADEACRKATVIGDVTAGDDSDPPMLIMRTRIGSERIVDLLSGEQLPRIC